MQNPTLIDGFAISGAKNDLTLDQELIDIGYSEQRPAPHGLDINALYNMIFQNLNFIKEYGFFDYEATKIYKVDQVAKLGDIIYIKRQTEIVAGVSPATNPDRWLEFLSLKDEFISKCSCTLVNDVPSSKSIITLTSLKKSITALSDGLTVMFKLDNNYTYADNLTVNIDGLGEKTLLLSYNSFSTGDTVVLKYSGNKFVNVYADASLLNDMVYQKSEIDAKSVGLKNYFINGGFDIWQRGASGSGGYVADRMLFIGVTLVSENSTGFANFYRNALVNRSSNGVAQCSQRIESKDAISLIGDYVTFQFQYKYVSGTVSAIDVEFHYPTAEDDYTLSTLIETVNIADLSDGLKTVTSTNVMPSDISKGLEAIVKVTVVGDTSYRTTGWQLEKGSIATAFERRPIGLELLLCQRYLPIAELSGYAVAGQAFGATTGAYPVRLNVPARVAPTGFIQLTGGITVGQANGGNGGGTFSLTWTSKSHVVFHTIDATGLVAGNASMLLNGGKIIFTGCEL